VSTPAEVPVDDEGEVAPEPASEDGRGGHPVAVVTGASRGIGRFVADALEDAGYAVERGSTAVAPVTDRAGTFVNWEGRVRPFGKVLHNPSSLPDLRVLAGIAEELSAMGVGRPLGFRTSEEAWAEMAQVGPWDGVRPAVTAPETDESGTPAAPLVLASWKQQLDDGRMQDGDEAMRRTARKPVVLASRATLDSHGLAVGDIATLSGPRGSVSLPVGVADLAEGTVWAPASAPGLPVRELVGPAGSPVTLSVTTAGGHQ
jgi:NADH-quinone oxidoreductase subunit G